MAKNIPTTEPKLLSGGNPQIAKGEGDASVQAYIAAMPGWKLSDSHIFSDHDCTAFDCVELS